MNRPSLCWRCKKLIGLDPVCPYCGAKNTGAARALPKLLSTLSGGSTPQLLLYFCVFMFALTVLAGITLHGNLQALTSPSGTLMRYMGMNIFGHSPAHWWSMVTGVFLHVGLLHLGFNLYGLFILGRFLEGQLSGSLLWVVFMLSALAGAFVTASFGNASAGASGGLFGWMGAALYVAFKTGGTRDPAFRSLIFWAGFSLLLGFSMSARIDNHSHVVGLIAGLFLTSVWSAFGAHRVFQKAIQVAAVMLLLLVIFSHIKQLPFILRALTGGF